MNINELERLEGEEWREHESGLFVSNLGRVFVPKSGTNKEHYSYGSDNGRGYKQVTGKQYKVHRLVAECFIPNSDNLPTVDHINRNPSDNRVENLRWADMSLQAINRNNINRKNDAKSKQVMQIDPSTNKVIRIWESTQECARNGMYNISACCLGKRKQSNGFKWQYA